MIPRSLRSLAIVLLPFSILIATEAPALAGVTGGLAGTVIEADTSAPIAGAQVIVASPSQSTAAMTDAAGRFFFLTLAPDTYTVTVSKGYQPTSIPGQSIFADTVQSLTVRLPKTLKMIAHVSAAAAGTLVKSGTTADVYSINDSTQQATDRRPTGCFPTPNPIPALIRARSARASCESIAARR